MDNEHSSPCQRSSKAHSASPLCWSGLDSPKLLGPQHKVSSPCQGNKAQYQKTEQ